jgi:glycosyltransferase involved in cell wall biosynthesis
MDRQDRTTVFEAAGSAAQLSAAVGACNVVVGMRYHSALFAMRCGTPVVGLVYDPKVRQLFTTAACDEYAIDIGALRADDLTALIDRALGDPGLPDRLRQAADQLAEAASRTAPLVAESLAAAQLSPKPPSAAATRAWLDELTAAASGLNDDAFLGLDALRSAIAERRREIEPQPGLYDVICFPGIEWDFRWMRAQQLMSQFADRGHRVFFVSTAKALPPDGAKFAVRPLRANVWEVRLATPQAISVYSGVMAEEVERAIVVAISALAREFAIGSAVSMLHLATWATAAGELRARFAWPVIYDCMDDWSGFAWMPDALLNREVDLVRDADLVVTTAQKLWDKWSALNPNTLLARNAADIAHFQHDDKAASVIHLPASRTIIGFFGAIDSWFDVELVRHAATERPDYFFALIGEVLDAPVEQLRQLPNVRFFGHQPYHALPAWLRRFDACLIPFKINAVTQATDPVKFYEYLAQAKPVVSSRLPELELYRDILYLADGPEDFLRLLDVAVNEHDPQLCSRRLAAAGENTWAARYQRIDSAIQATLAPDSPPAVSSAPGILFVCPVFILGGVEVILKDRAAELLLRGWRVRLVAMDDAGGQVLFENSGMDSRICPDEAALARELLDFQPDWIVSLDTPAILPVARRTAPRAALVYEVHSTYPHTLAPLVDRGFLAGVRGILVPSESQAARIRSLLAVEMPFEVVPNALAPEFLEGGDAPLTTPSPVVLWVGRLDSLKNWRAFVELASQLDHRTEAHFHLVSGGPFDETEGEELQGAVARLDGRLSWTREIDHQKMPALYRLAAQSGGCLVSTSSAESFGMAVLEAMACGCPVVAPDIQGLRDLVRHGESGRLYPAGDLAAAGAEILETLRDSPDSRRQITEAARHLALQFGPEAAAERFLAALSAWSDPCALAAPQAAPIELEPVPALLPEREALARILAAKTDARKVVIFPPFIPWSAAGVSGRPQQWARALAARGCLVFYCDPQETAGTDAFREVEPRIVVANVSLQVYDMVEAPVVVVHSYNLPQLSRFRNPVVVYECLDVGHNRSPLEEEWLARAAVVVARSEEVRDAVAAWRPDALLIPEIEPENAGSALLTALENASARESDPARLRTVLMWRERQIHRLETQIQERDRPAVEILHGAVSEQKRIIMERDKGIAFLRSEVASRDRIIAERERAVEFLKHEVGYRDAALSAHLQEDEPRERGRQATIDALQHEAAAQQAIIAARDQDIEFLRQEIAVRDRRVAALEEAIESLRQEAAARVDAFEYLRHEVAVRDQRITAREEGIEYLRQEVAAREAIIESVRHDVMTRDAEIAALQATVRDLESRLPWWRRRK